MNDKGREVLVGAAMAGVKQVFGDFERDGGVCGLGALGIRDTLTPREWNSIYDLYGIGVGGDEILCPECGGSYRGEDCLITHLNDFHHFDFLTIARKVPNSEPSA